MEDLFSTNITVHKENVTYHVAFDRDRYLFVPEAGTTSFPSFSFRREHDQWTGEGLLTAGIKEQALDALEKYLMKQH